MSSAGRQENEAKKRIFEPLFNEKMTGPAAGQKTAADIIQGYRGCISVGSISGMDTAVYMLLPRFQFISRHHPASQRRSQRQHIHIP